MSLVAYSLEDGIARITLSRPDKRNALSDAMLAELGACVDRAAAEAQAAVIAGAGEHFSAGLDLAEHAEKSVLDGIAGSRSWHEVFRRIQYGRIPYVAALHGGVIGGGLELAAVAHVRVADTTAFFALPEGTRGIFVGGGGSVSISRLMGTARMMDLMLTGRVLTAEEAERIGIVTYLTGPGGAVARATELARKAAQNAPLSNYAIINALPRIADAPQDDGLFFESMIASLTSGTPEAKARLRAFVEKRAARVAAPKG